jgi:hypothetical protein
MSVYFSHIDVVTLDAERAFSDLQVDSCVPRQARAFEGRALC